MLAIAIIVFREVLEAALIVSIVMAASTGISGRNRWVGYGMAGGIAGAAMVAGFAATIAATFAGIGQELLNAAIVFLAVVMLGWHNVWMARHGRDLAQRARTVSQAVTTGARPLSALALITGAAVLREGSETVLFVYSVAASSADGLSSMAAGALLGVAGGIIVGVGLYFGLLRIPVGRLFAVTSWMILMLAAGLAAQGAGFLMQADLLPPLGLDLWDTSFLLTETSILGKVLHTLIGYIAQPAGVQILFYVLTIVVIVAMMRLFGKGEQDRRRLVTALVITILSTGCLVGMTQRAQADMLVRSPFVVWRELEFEHNGLITFGPKGSATDRAQSYTNAIAYGVTPWWKIELEGELASGGGQHLTWAATTLENYFQLTERGKYLFDAGLFLEYSQATGLSPNAVTFGPILYKELPAVLGVDTGHTLNLFFSHDVGGNATRATGFQVAWQSVAFIKPWLSPGFEYYANIPDIAHSRGFNQQQHFVGPVLTGLQNFAPYGKLKYEVGYLFGLTTATPKGAIRWKLEYEISF